MQAVINKNYNSSYYVTAEITQLNYYPHNGHCYPELIEKEGELIKAKMRAVIWSTQFRTISAKFEKITGEKLKNGIKILCLATVQFSPQYGLSLQILDIEPTYTLGEMAKNKLAVIEKLKSEGIFTANKQTILPAVPKKVAVISVETSKGYSDFMITLRQNNWNYLFDCQLFPAILQGERAVTTIIEQLTNIEQRLERFDCVAIIRGGGDDAGLSCYDNYDLARKVATFPIPVLAGIGHSTNQTVTELVSYENKITPTEVAYFLIQKFHDFAICVEELQEKLTQLVIAKMDKEAQTILTASQLITLLSKKIIDNQQQKMDNFTQLIQLFSRQKLKEERENISKLTKNVELLHPDNVLKRGFSITLRNGKAVTDARQLVENEQITTKFYIGETESIIKKIQ